MILWCFSLVWAAESPEWYAAQARQFQKRGWTADAEAQVLAGLKLAPDHLGLNALCVELARATVDIPRAIECAARGVSAPDGELELRAELSRLESWMRENFGLIEVKGPDGMPRGRLDIRPTGLILDPELKANAAQVTQEAADGIELPARLSLPVGEYEVEGSIIQVEAGQTTIVSLSPSAFAAKAGRGVRLEMAAGGSGYLGHGFENQLPGGQFELGLGLPAGALRLGFAATWQLRPYTRKGAADIVSPYGWGGKMRLGAEVEIGTALLLHPAATLSIGQLPGIEMACSEVEGSLACAAPATEAGDETVYVVGWLVSPGFEVAFAQRLGTSMLGVRVGGGHVFGQIPSPGPVTRSGELDTYSVAEPEMHAWTGQIGVFYAVGL